MLRERRIEHPDQRAAGPARGGQLRQGDGRQVLRFAPLEVLGLRVGVVRPQERLGGPAAQHGAQGFRQSGRRRHDGGDDLAVFF